MNELEAIRSLISEHADDPLGVIGILLALALLIWVYRGGGLPKRPPSGEGANKATPHDPLSSEVDMDTARGINRLQAPSFEIIHELIKQHAQTVEVQTEGVKANMEVAKNLERVAAQNQTTNTLLGEIVASLPRMIHDDGNETRAHLDSVLTPLVKAIDRLADRTEALTTETIAIRNHLMPPPPPSPPKVIALPVIEEAPKKRGRRKKTLTDDVVQEKVA